MNQAKHYTLLKQNLVLKIREYNELKKYLYKNFNSCDRVKVISDLNIITVEIKTINFKLNNLIKGNPILGETISEINNQINNIIN